MGRFPSAISVALSSSVLSSRVLRSRVLAFRGLALPVLALSLLAGCPQPPVNTDDAGSVNPPLLVYDSGPPAPETDGGAEEDGGVILQDAGPSLVGLDSVSPPAGPLGGGERVRIEGFGFAPPPPDGDQHVFFGEHEATNCLLLPGGRSMTCQVPAGDEPGPISVRVENALGVVTEENLYTYFSPVTLLALSPAIGTDEGGTVVTLTGEGFNDEMLVLFGERQAAALTVNAEGTEATVRTPPGLPGRVHVAALDEFGGSTLELGFRYVAGLALTAVNPAAGEPGDIIDLHGAGFNDATTARIDADDAPVRNLVNQGRLRVEVPQVATGLKDVTVALGGDEVTLAGAFYVLDPPTGALTITAVVPPEGDVAGGDVVTIVGDGLERTSDVTIGGTAATDFEVVSNREVRVTLPAGSLGPAQFIIVTNDPGSVTWDGFSYVSKLGLGAASPDSGPVDGGTAVTLTGRGFVADMSVRVGGVEVSDLVLVSDTELTFVTPAGSSGHVDIVVVSGAQTARIEDGFRYEADLRVLGVHPVRGSMSGNTWATISGQGFSRDGDLMVLFGNMEATEAVVVNDAIITVRTPIHAPGIVDVTVTIGSSSSAAERAFTYFDPTFLVGGTRGGAIDGAVYVTALNALTGMPIEGLVGFLGTEGEGEYTGVTNILGQVTLSGPGVVGPQTVSIAGDGWEYASLIDINASEITLYLQPLTGGPPAGGGQPPPPPPPATIRGRVFGFAKEFFDPAALGPDEIALAIVVTTARDEFSGTPNAGGQNVVFQEGGEYFIANSRPGRVALVALAGIFNIATGEFRLRQMGVRRPVFPQLGVDLIDEDITLSIPLDQEVDLSLPDAPVGLADGPTVTRVIPFLRFGGEGSLAYTDAVDTSRNHQLDTMPDVPGEMLTFIAGAFTTDNQFGLIKDEGTIDLISGERFAFGDGTTWGEVDPFTGVPVVDGAILVVDRPDGGRWATTVTASQSNTELLLNKAPPFTGASLTYHIGNPSLPSSEVVQDGVGDLIGGVTIQPVLGLPEPLSPLKNGVLENRTLRWKPAPGQLPSVHQAYVYDPFAFSTLWTFYIDGARSKVPIPRIPYNVAALPVETPPKDMSVGGYAWQHISMYTPGFDYENFSYLELGTRARRSWTTDFLYFVYPGD